MKNIMLAIEQIGYCCISALLSEIHTTPKPGLVDCLNNGAHKDMDISTFKDSINAIAPYFYHFAEIGRNLDCIDAVTLDKIRPLGLECEKAMFNATKGVNTHKGAIFSLGIIAVAAGYCCNELQDLSADTVCHAVSTIAKAAEKDFLRPYASLPMTKGREIYTAYGIRGIRGEAASGFYSVRKYALPVMKELFFHGEYSDNDIYLQVLLHLMTQVVDTNVIARCGIDAIEYVKSSADNILALGGALSPDGIRSLFKLDEDFIKRNISPGGCADLLSVTIALYRIENLLYHPYSL